jgi:hypothetical protein
MRNCNGCTTFVKSKDGKYKPLSSDNYWALRDGDRIVFGGISVSARITVSMIVSDEVYQDPRPTGLDVKLIYDNVEGMSSYGSQCIGGIDINHSFDLIQTSEEFAT